jgi:hypothetical protein
MGTDEPTPSLPLAQAPPTTTVYVIRKHGRAFAIADPAGTLVCLTVYLRGAFEVIRRLGGVAVYTKPEQRYVSKGKSGSWRRQRHTTIGNNALELHLSPKAQEQPDQGEQAMKEVIHVLITPQINLI